MMTMVVIGGLGSVTGAVLGAIFVFAPPILFPSSQAVTVLTARG